MVTRFTYYTSKCYLNGIFKIKQQKIIEKDFSDFDNLYLMEIEEIRSAEKNDTPVFSEKEERKWNSHTVSSFQKKREKELWKLDCERPSQEIDPQNYFTYRAREEQIKYELDFRQCGVEFLSGHGIEALVHTPDSCQIYVGQSTVISRQ